MDQSQHPHPHQHPLFGIVAEFAEPEQLLRAANRATAAGYRRVEAYSPYPIEGLAESLRFNRTWVPVLALLGGVLGGTAGFALQYWSSVWQYPLNVGGRPLNSWPMFVPVTFECTVLGASLFCVLGMLALNGLPRPHHPLFDVPGFERASADRFFLCIQAQDDQFHETTTRGFLHELGAVRVSDVPQ
jgi:hypothetical protein